MGCTSAGSQARGRGAGAGLPSRAQGCWETKAREEMPSTQASAGGESVTDSAPQLIPCQLQATPSPLLPAACLGTIGLAECPASRPYCVPSPAGAMQVLST